MELYFSTGQVAEDLAITPDAVRRLCQSGAIKAELTQGNQYRIPQAERQRLLREGPPPMPRPLPGDKNRTATPRPGTTHPGLLAPPSPNLVQGAEQVAMLDYEVRRLRLERRRDNELDHIRRREDRLRQERQRQEEAVMVQQEALEAEQQRVAWLRSWEENALSSLPSGSEPESRLEVHRAVREQFADLDPIPNDDVCRELVKAIVEKATRRERCRRESQDAVRRVMAGLPWDIQYRPEYGPVKSEALTLMSDAVARLPLDARVEVKEAAALRAVGPILLQYDHHQACGALVRGLPNMLPQANADEREAARRTLTAALEQLPVGTPQTRLESVRDEVVRNVLGVVKQRLESEHRAREAREKQRVEESRRLSAGWTVDRVLMAVDDVVREAEKLGAVEFDGWNDRWETHKEIRSRVRAAVVEKLVAKPEMSLEEIRQRVMEVAREKMVEVLEETEEGVQ